MEPEAPAELLDASVDVKTNEDLMNKILLLLDVQGVCVASAVCKLWHQLSQSPAFWHEVVIRKRRVTKDQVARLSERHPGIRRLVLCETALGMVDEYFFRQAMRHWQMLETLELGKEMVSESCLSMLNETRVPALHTLLFTSLTFGPGQPECELAHSTLREVSLHDCRVGRLALRCPALRKLSLRSSCISSMRVQLPALTRLDLSGCSKMTDAAVRSCLLQLPLLQELNLRSLTCVTDDTLQEAASHLSVLEYLDISACTLVTLNGVRSFSRLRSLDMSGCNSFLEAASALQACSALETLCMDNCASLTSLHLASPSLTSLSLQGCQALHTLDLQCISLAQLKLSDSTRTPYPTCSALRQVRLRSTALTALSWRGFPALEELDLDTPALEALEFLDCDRLSASALDALSDTTTVPTSDPPGAALVTRTGGCPHLRSLRLDSCDGLRSLTLRHATLAELALGGCKGLERLALQCRCLDVLLLEECTGLEVVELAPAGVRALGLGSCASLRRLLLDAPSLASLDLRGCAMLSQLRLSAPLLQQLDTSFCSCLSDEALRAAIAPCPPLQRLIMSVCSSLGAQGLAALSPLSTLTLLDISYTTVDNLAPVYASCPGLRSLSASSCPNLHPSCVEALLPTPASNGALPQLQHLDLSYTHLPPSTTTALLRLGSRFQTLALNGCKGVTEDIWKALLPPPPTFCWEPQQPHQLATLSLVKCGQLATLCLGAQPLIPIQVLTSKPYLPPSLRHPEGGETLSWGPAPRGLPALTSLRLGLASVQVVALHLPRLALLDLSGCSHLRRLELRCPALHTILLQGCMALQSGGLQQALEGCPLLEVLDLQRVVGGQQLAAQLQGATQLRSLLICPPACTCASCIQQPAAAPSATIISSVSCGQP